MDRWVLKPSYYFDTYGCLLLYRFLDILGRLFHWNLLLIALQNLADKFIYLRAPVIFLHFSNISFAINLLVSLGIRVSLFVRIYACLLVGIMISLVYLYWSVHHPESHFHSKLLVLVILLLYHQNWVLFFSSSCNQPYVVSLTYLHLKSFPYSIDLRSFGCWKY